MITIRRGVYVLQTITAAMSTMFGCAYQGCDSTRDSLDRYTWIENSPNPPQTARIGVNR